MSSLIVKVVIKKIKLIVCDLYLSDFSKFQAKYPLPTTETTKFGFQHPFGHGPQFIWVLDFVFLNVVGLLCFGGETLLYYFLGVEFIQLIFLKFYWVCSASMVQPYSINFQWLYLVLGQLLDSGLTRVLLINSKYIRHEILKILPCFYIIAFGNKWLCTSISFLYYLQTFHWIWIMLFLY